MTTTKISIFDGTVWAIEPGKAQQIAAFYTSWLNGNFQANGFEGGNNTQKDFQVDNNGIAHIALEGVMLKKVSPMAAISGGVSTRSVATMIQDAEIDVDVKGILIDVDSPGGPVDAVSDLSSAIKAVSKPVHVFSDGQISSAAMWVSSAADHISITSTATAGSIGVISVHVDTSQHEMKEGIVKTVIHSGEFKAVGAKPLTVEAKEYMQDLSDRYHGMFVSEVATNRGMEIDAVLLAANGKIFVGNDALNLGLVDAISSRQEAYDTLLNTITGGNMNKEEFKANQPDLFNEVMKDGASSVDLESSRKAWATEEQNRIKAICEISGASDGMKLKAILGGHSASSAFQLFWNDAINKKDEEAEVLLKASKESKTEGIDFKKTDKKVDAVAQYDAKIADYKAAGLNASSARLKMVQEHNDLYNAYLESFSK